jgi:hypothetical protein
VRQTRRRHRARLAWRRIATQQETCNRLGVHAIVNDWRWVARNGKVWSTAASSTNRRCIDQFKENIMGQSKDDWLEHTGGLFASPIEKHARMRIHVLNEKLKCGPLTEDERTEMLRLLNSLPDDEEW